MNNELIEAAKAVIARWESPLWKDAEPTAVVMNRLRNALSEPAKPELPQSVQFVVDWLLYEAETLGDGCDGDTAKRAARLIQQHAQREAAHAAEIAAAKEQGRREALQGAVVLPVELAELVLTWGRADSRTPLGHKYHDAARQFVIAIEAARAAQEVGNG